MQIKGKDIRWTITGAAQDLAPYAALDSGSGPEGQDTCLVTVSKEGLVEASEERYWDVLPGRAYQLTIMNRADSERCHGQAYLIWLDENKQSIAKVPSAHTFARHGFSPLILNEIAPAQARYARSSFRVLPDTWLANWVPQGGFWVTAAVFMPSVAVVCQPTASCALYDAGMPVVYSVSLTAAPAELKQSEMQFRLYDYTEKCLYNSSLVIRLAGGAGTATLELPALGPGYYEVHTVTTTQGLASVALDKSFGCLEALDFTIAQDTPIALDAGISQPFVNGLAGGNQSPEPTRFAEQAAACYKLGLRTLRDRFHWQDVQPTPDTFDWGRYRQAANDQHAAGIDVYHILSGPPSWLLGSGSENRSLDRPFSNYPPNDMRPVYDFCARAAREMGHAVRYWEFWNEPDIFFFAGHPWDLAAMTKAGALGIKDVDPTIGILGGSRASFTNFWQNWLANGVGPYIDIYNQHSYGKPEDEFAMIQQDLDIMAEVGMARPIWMTEMGKRSIPNPDGAYTLAERIQVVYLLRSFACGLAAGIDRFFYFFLQEFLEAGAAVWGIQRKDLSPKPAVLALGALVRQIGQARVVGYLVEDERYCVVFERIPGEYTAMAWSTKNTLISDGWGAPNPVFEPGQDWMAVEGEFDLPVIKGARLVDALGREVETCSGATHHLKLSLCPVFVRGIDPTRMTLTPPPTTLHYVSSNRKLSDSRHIWLQALSRPNEPRLSQADAQAQKYALLIRQGEAEQVAFLVHNYTQYPATVALALDEPAGWQIDQVLNGADDLGQVRVVPLEVQANGDARIVVRYQPLALGSGKTWCMLARLYLDGAPHDQAAVYFSTELGRRFHG